MSEPKDPAESADVAKNGDPIDTRLVRKLAAIFKDTDLTEIEVERDGLRIRLVRGSAVVAASAPVTVMQAPVAVAAGPAVAAAPAVPAAPVRAAGDLVKSPMVGTVYMSPQPGAEAFVKPGDKVAEGQTLLIIEAMKTMNPIPAPRAGVVAELLVGDGQP
ncbi:MAG: acetyl-CoA carboxylase biotin carboxyl carrier protein subunit, partial [Caulobacteraceae bacterium]